MQNEICYCNGEEISTVNQLIFLFSVIPFTILTAFILSSIFVEKCVWRPYVKKSMEEMNEIDWLEEEIIQEVYTDKYLFDRKITSL